MLKRILCCLLVTTLLIDSSIAAAYAIDEHIAIQRSNVMWQQILDAELIDETAVTTEEVLHNHVNLQTHQSDIDAATAKEMDMEAFEKIEKVIDTEYLSNRFIISYRLADDIVEANEVIEGQTGSVNETSEVFGDGSAVDNTNDIADDIAGETNYEFNGPNDTEAMAFEDYSRRAAPGGTAVMPRNRGSESVRVRKSLNEARRQISSRLSQNIVSIEEIVDDAAELNHRAEQAIRSRRFDRKLRVETNELMTAQEVFEKIYQEDGLITFVQPDYHSTFAHR